MALIDDLAGAAAIAVTPFAAAGPTPNQTDYARLVAFGKAQYTAYEKTGVANPALAPFEALGRSYASDDVLKVTFGSTNGRGNASDFVETFYTKVFGSAPTAAAKGNLVSQISYFETLYRGAGIAANDAFLQAKGAVFGQIIGYAFIESVAGAKTGLDDVVNALVTEGNAGNFANFGKPLPPYKTVAGAALPVNGAVVITPQTALDEFDLNPVQRETFVANPNFHSNRLEKFVVGQDKIDLHTIAFGPNVVLAALPASGGSDATFYQSGGKQYAAVMNSGGLFVDVNGNGKNDAVGDLFIQLIGTQGNPGTADLIFL